MVTASHRLLLAAWGLAALGAVPAPSDAPLAVVDLASDTAWTLSVDDGPARPIRVPGGGYNSDRQDRPWIDQTRVRDHVLYQRTVTIPRVREGQVTLVEFGAVNFGAEVFLADGEKETPVGSHDGPLMPFAADLTHAAVPGKTYTLKVRAYTVSHYRRTVPVGFVYEEAWKPNNGWASRFGQGIVKYVRLAVYPEVFISDVFVRTSVSGASLGVEARVRNHSSSAKTLSLAGRLSSWNGDPWKYPALPEAKVTVEADSEAAVTIGPVPWDLGPESWWWPNKPFREDYRAKLHVLKLSLLEGGAAAHGRDRRFGFVEWTEGPAWYLVNGVRVNFISDGTPESAMSDYDCYSTSPAFLRPGCDETWRRYMRMGICANRIHQSTPTEAMMDAADELGFMLIPETAIRGCQDQKWHDVHLPRAAKELALACRDHPSVCRYSLLNEAPPAWVPKLVDALREVDDTRPLVFEDNQQNRPGKKEGTKGGHAWCMLHYQRHPKPAAVITGLGECAWANCNGLGDGLERFAGDAADGRRWDNVYYAGWDWINYWPNFLQGMDARRHAWRQKECWHEDRRDGVDGWESPVIRWAQKCFHPYLVMDVGIHEDNPVFQGEWPRNVPEYAPGEAVERKVEVFNDGLSGERFALKWSARWDSPAGEAAASGTVPDLVVKPGFHAAAAISFKAPPSAGPRKLFLVIESLKEGKAVFREDQVYLVIAPGARAGRVEFLGEDKETRGDWGGKYGSAGHILAGREPKPPADAGVTWQAGEVWTWEKETDDARGLACGKGRVAAARYGPSVEFLLDAGPAPRKVTFYVVDWDRHGRQQTFEFRKPGGALLDRRTVSAFQGGAYLSWRLSGRVRVTVSPNSPPNAVVSAVFFDPADAAPGR